MKFKNVIAAGCSWVDRPYQFTCESYDFELTKEHSFSQLLANKLDVDCYNIASGGASMDYVFQKLQEYLPKVDNSLIIIGLTEPTRFSISGSRFKFTDAGDGHWNWRKYFFKHFYDENLRVYEIIRMLDTLNIIFKYRNSHLLVFNSFAKGIKYPKRDYFFEGFGKYETWASYIYSIDKNFSEDGRHPYYSHHIHLSNLIYEYLYKNVL
jgi:hypothetical protein